MLTHPTNRAMLAYERWCMATDRNPANRDSLITFTTFTGDPYDERRGIYINTENPEVMRKVDMILGPNGHTILKMMLLQNEETR